MAARRRFRAAAFLLVVAAVAALSSAVAAGPGAAAQTVADIETRDRLIADQENLLNTYRCLFDVDTGVVPGGCPDPDEVLPGAAPQNPSRQDIDVRDQLVQSQEALLNVYRCRFDVDTQIVPGGCVNGAPAPQPTPTAEPVPEVEHDDSRVTATPVPEDVADDDRNEWTADPDTGVPVVTQVSSHGSISGNYPSPVDYIPQDHPVVLAAVNACTAGIYAWAQSEGLVPDGHVLDRQDADLMLDSCMIHIEQLAPFVEHYGVDWACATAGIGDLAAAGNVFPNGVRGNWWDCPNIAWDCSDDCDPIKKVRQAAPEGEVAYYAKLMQQAGNRLEIESAHLLLMSGYFKGQGLPVPVRGS